MSRRYAHGAMGLGQKGGLVLVTEESNLPVGAVGMVLATDRHAWPAAGFAEVLVPGVGRGWVADISLLPVLATR